ncbi:helix-turn-helix domain-containing protein [Marinobacterium sp. D7]|uniref:helix-turn-helix domain-containing protein n=1 Tax=Marinobacterium ramblicola TaxID=2849041 RepID=UPI001C2D9BEA|nr:helix-turn-helix transcriptional regulator [Marinobacterium ramblicola]MBV1788334.1 helix-turn-helix domain-containing protein [Marinobacterium ramblicola]
MDFVQNLKLLCSFYNSTAEVCRKMGVNRTQFNKYLSGQIQPSKANLKIICDFFGVEEFEILMPHEKFRQEVMPDHTLAQQHPALPTYFSKMMELYDQSRIGLGRYVGWYYEYYYSLGFPGRIFCSLIEITPRQDGIGFSRYERLIPVAAKGRKVTHCHYRGIAINLCDRIFLMDYETLTINEITQTVLFPSYKSQLTRLFGVKIGVSSKSHREPACTRVMYQFLGESIDFRKHFRHCGLYQPDEVDADIREAIDNRQERDNPLFIAIGE